MFYVMAYIDEYRLINQISSGTVYKNVRKLSGLCYKGTTNGICSAGVSNNIALAVYKH